MAPLAVSSAGARDQVRHAAELLAAALTAAHGGSYWIHVDYVSGVVAVSRIADQVSAVPLA